MNSSTSSSCSYPQTLVDQRPAFDGKRKRKYSSNQAMSKRGIIRSDKRRKVKFL